MSDSDFWTEDREQLLITLWNKGLSGGDIGHIMGATRSAIIGKKTRMGLPKRVIDATAVNRRPIRAQSTANGVRVTVSAPPRAKPKDYPPIDPTNPGVAIEALKWEGGRPSTCRAIISPDGHKKTMYCGMPNKAGESFCHGHCKIYFTPFRNSRVAASISTVVK